MRGRPEVILGGRTDRIVWSASLGFDIRGAQTFANVEEGTMFDYGAGLGFLFLDDRSLQIGPELYGSLTLNNLSKRTTNAELLIDVRYRVISPIEIAIGAGPGLAGGIGTPDFRGVLSVAYTPEMSRDRDHDGILDKDDACPDVPGVPEPDPKKNGWPQAGGPRRRRHPRQRGRLPRRARRARPPIPKKNGWPRGVRRRTRRHPRHRGRVPRRARRARSRSEEERLPARP